MQQLLVEYVRNHNCELRRGCSGIAEMKILVYVKRAYNCIACVFFFFIGVKKRKTLEVNILLWSHTGVRIMDLFQYISSMIILQYFKKGLIKSGTLHYIFLMQNVLTAMGWIQPRNIPANFRSRVWK